MKIRKPTPSTTAPRQIADDRAGRRPAASATAARTADSPRMAVQRRQIDAAFGTAQRDGIDDEPLQGRFEAVQRMEEEAMLQGRFATAQLAGPEVEPLQGRFGGAQHAAPNRTGMPDGLKSGVESLSGMDLSDVRVHADSAEPARLGAHAYAQGNDIHLAPGQEQHLPHEAWHIVQQRQGRVQPTTETAGTPVNDDPGLESEADAMGKKALDHGR